MQKIMKYKEIIVLVLSVIAIFVWVGDAKQTNVQAEVNKAKLEKQQTSIDMLTAMVMKHEGTIEATMVMLGVDPDSAKKWSKLPQEPVTDTLGTPITDVAWVIYKEDMRVALLYKFMADDNGDIQEMFVDTLYDVREK